MTRFADTELVSAGNAVSTGVATMFVLSGQQLADTITKLNTSISSPRDIEALIDQSAAPPLLLNQSLAGE